MIPSENLSQCFENIHYDKTNKFEWPGKMRRAIRSEHSDFFKQFINNICLNDSLFGNLIQFIKDIQHD